MGDEDAGGPARGFSPADRFGADYPKLLLEQYKIYVETSNKISERRAGAQTFLLTANTLLVTVYSLAAGRDVPLSSAEAMWRTLVPLAGLAVTVAWFALIRSYGMLNTAKFDVINRMEERLPAQLFKLEWNALVVERKRTHLPLAAIEQTIPLIFSILYLALAVSALTS